MGQNNCGTFILPPNLSPVKGVDIILIQKTSNESSYTCKNKFYTYSYSFFEPSLLMITYYLLFRYCKTSEVNMTSLSFSGTDHLQANDLVTLHTISKKQG